jgi:hypothetical protein
MELDYMFPDELLTMCVPKAFENMLLVVLHVDDSDDVIQITRHLHGEPTDLCYLIFRWERGIPTGHFELVDPRIYDDFYNGCSLRKGFVRGVLFG